MTKNIANIVLIDDDFAINYFHKRLFLKLELGGTVLPFFNAMDALEGLLNLNKSLKKGDVVFVFLDINMPGIDGWVFLEEYNKIQSSLIGDFKIFVLSSSINPDDVEKAKKNPFVTDYLAKPLLIDGIMSLKEMYC